MKRDPLAPVYDWLIATVNGDIQRPDCADHIMTLTWGEDPALCKSLGVIHEIHHAIVRVGLRDSDREFESELPRKSRHRAEGMRNAAKSVNQSAIHLCNVLIESYERNPADFRNALMAARAGFYLGRAEHFHTLVVSGPAHERGVKNIRDLEAAVNATRKLPPKSVLIQQLAQVKAEQPGQKERYYQHVVADRYKATDSAVRHAIGKKKTAK